MKSVVAILFVVAAVNADHLLPVDTSYVNVKSEKNGQDYSYTIHENRGGVAIEPIVHTIHHTVPTLPIYKSHVVQHVEQHQVHQEKEAQPQHQEAEHAEVKAQPKAKEMQYKQLPMLSYQTPFYYIPASYRYAYAQYPYAYPYGYYYNYNLIPLKTE